jgi:ligand-binding sensor domain-containing protein/signal transduction histidine kinase
LYRVDSWKTDEGLPQSSVTSILQTRDSYLWLGTFGGLVRFDGVRFISFNPNNTTNLPSGRILALFEDRSRALWAGTEEGDLVRFADGEVKTFRLPNRGTASKYIRDFAETADGSLWVHTAENQLIRCLNGQFTVCSSDWTLAGNEVHSIETDASGQLWVGTEKELAVWEGGTFKTAWARTSEPNFQVDLLAMSKRGGLWVAGNGRLRKFENNAWVADYGAFPWSKGVLTSMLEDRRGRLWAGTYGSGLFRFDTNREMIQVAREEGLPGNLVRSLREDGEGNLWVGTEGDGLARLKPSIFRSFGNSQVLTVSEGKEGELWIGTNGEGIDRLKDGRLRHYGPEDGLINECVWSVLQDRNKTLWAGTWGGGLFKLEGDKFVQFVSPTDCGQVVCGLYEDSRGGLWLGQPWNEPQITRLLDGKPTVFRMPTAQARVDARAIIEDRAGNIWVGTRGDGLFRLTEGQCTRFTRQNGLNSDLILSLYLDAEGVLWIGTGRGLNRMQRDRFDSFTTRDGLADDVICFMTEDNRGQFWFGSGSGVFRVSKEELNRYAVGSSEKLHCFAYTKADGLPSLECSSGCQPAGCKTRDGRLWFPTVNGLAMVDPETVPFNPFPPPVVIEEVMIEGEPKNALGLPIARTDLVNRMQVATGQDSNVLRIPPGKQRFEFHFTGLSFTAPEKVKFKYRLERLETEWVEAGTRRTALYSYLQPGNYEFRVLACNNDGVWNEVGASLALIVLPHFWQTWWFRVLVVAGGLLLLAAAYELRLASERRLNRLRLRIARDLHDEVGSNLGSIALLSEVMPKSAPGSPEEVSEIRRIAVHTIESLRDIVWFLDPASDKLAEMILRMKEVSRTMLPAVPFEFETAGGEAPVVPSLEFRRNIFPIFKEILHNIAKHAHASRVNISVAVTPRDFLLRVRDDGVGFEETGVRKGNGLKNLRRRVNDLKGKIDFQTAPGAGTTVVVSLPIP